MGQKEESLANHEARGNEQDEQSIGLKRVNLALPIDHRAGKMRIAEGDAQLE